MISIAEERCEEIEKKDDLIFGLFEQVDQLKDNVEILQHVSKPRGRGFYEILVQNVFEEDLSCDGTKLKVHFRLRVFSDQSLDRKCTKISVTFMSSHN